MDSRSSRIVQQGFIAGIIGYATVAGLILLTDIAGGHPAFFTPALLGSRLFYGLSNLSDLRIWPAPIFAYNGVHLLVFLGFGFLVAWLAELSESGPQFWYAGLVVLLAVAFHLFGFVFGSMASLETALSPWPGLAAGTAAAVAMAAFLLKTHPRLRQVLRTSEEDA